MLCKGFANEEKVEKEYQISGLCDACWDAMFGMDEEDL